MTRKEIRMLILLLIVSSMIIVNGDKTKRNTKVKEMNKHDEAATYIQFIMNLLSGRNKLTLKEKFSVSQNVYNAFRKQKTLVENRNLQHEENNQNKTRALQNHNGYSYNPYYLRF